MALSDYRLCDVCKGKAFYDANLNYEDGEGEWVEGRAPYRTAGREQYDEPELLQKYGMRLGSVGDWAVICADCAKTHRTAILPIEGAASPAEPAAAMGGESSSQREQGGAS